GHYYVSATAQAQTIGTPTANGIDLAGERNGFASVLYPAAVDSAAAHALTVSAGQTISGIDIALQSVRLATISGIALDGMRRPLTGGGASATVRGVGPPALGLLNGPVRADGTFMLPNVPPGEYLVRVAAPRPAQTGSPADPPEFSVAFVTIDGADVSGVTLVP